MIIYCLSPQIKRINHDSNEVLIDIPEGRYTQDQLRGIHEVAAWICVDIRMIINFSFVFPGVQKSSGSNVLEDEIINSKGGGKSVTLCR